MKRFNKTNGMYALLIAVAAMIGITIYGSCSADEDYDGYSSKDELFTLADGEMNLRTEGVNNRLYASPTCASIPLCFKPQNNSNDSTLFIYDTCNITINFSCNDNYTNPHIESIDCPFDIIGVYNEQFITWYYYNLTKAVHFKVSAKIEREINNTIYSSVALGAGRIKQGEFHYN